MRAKLASLNKLALDFLLPQTCLGCGREGELICSSCRDFLPELEPPYCPVCGLPLNTGQICPDCAGGGFVLNGLRAPFRFERLVREAVHQFKYQNLRSLAAPFAGFLAGYLHANPLPVEVIVPVPLHPRRLKERGYNQALLLAHELGLLTGLPVVNDDLIRRRHTPPQARTASLAERRQHMLALFACRDGKLKGKKVLLLDDVATSGATLNGCAAALKQAGATSVWGLTLAREV